MNLDYWNELFNNRHERLPPEEYLICNIQNLKGDTVLDLGCGDGRNSFYLAEKGFNVTAIDFSKVGLQKIEALKNRSIQTMFMNINDSINLKSIGKYDNILLNHFIPDPSSLLVIPELLNANGRIIITAFDKRMKDLRSNTKNLILDFNSIIKIMPCMVFIKKESVKDDRGYLTAVY